MTTPMEPTKSPCLDAEPERSKPTLNSRWAPPVASLPNQASSTPFRQSIDDLKKRVAANKGGKEYIARYSNADDLSQTTVSSECDAEKAGGGAVISNLEESYFKRPAMTTPMKTPIGSVNSRKNTRIATAGLAKQSILSEGSVSELKVASRVERDDEHSSSSEATLHHSNKINKNDQQTSATEDHADDDETYPESTPTSSKKTPWKNAAALSGNNTDAEIAHAGVDEKSPKSKDGGLALTPSKKSPGEIGAVSRSEPSSTDVELARAKAESKRLAKEREQAEAKFKADMERALAESQKEQPRRNAGNGPAAAEVICLDVSDDEEDSKMPTKVKANDEEEGEAISSAAINESSGQYDDAQMKKAIRLSLEESERAKQHQLSETNPLTYRILNRDGFRDAVNEFVKRNGGYEKIESGQLIRNGNTNDMKKTEIADGGGLNQTGAQYGRYSIERLWRLFDVLEGKDNLEIDDGDRKLASSPDREATKKRALESNSRLEGLPGAKIKAFLDIGHGIGIQVLQAGWALGVPARGVEIMKPRHLVAMAIRDGVLESLRKDPPDATMVDLELADFSLAIVPDKKTKKRDEQLRSFLLFKDKSMEVQKGLVIFVNNAEEVFAARSNQRKDCKCLDAYLANLFANMEVGGRMVTLTDVSCQLTQSSEWFCHDVFQSGSHAVSWGSGNKSIDIHVLTKLSDKWYCQEKRCDSKFLGASNVVVNEDGDLCESCVYCNSKAKRCSRVRRPASKKLKKDIYDF